MTAPVAYGSASNVIVGEAYILIAPLSGSAPTLPPPSTVGLAGGTAWPSPWVLTGFTESGLTFSVNRKTTDIMVEEQITPIEIVTDTGDVILDFAFMEDTLANMAQAYGGATLVATAATSMVAGYSTLSLLDSLTAVAIGFEATNTLGFPRQVIVPKVVSASAVKTPYRRAKAARSYPVTYRAICDMPAIQIQEITAVPT